MKKLETYVSELLYKHDMVILPGFGALIGRRKPAKIDRKRGLFIPPSKEISFNAAIHKNDGLLIHHISEKENIPYQQAAQFVSSAIAQWKNELQSKGTLRLKDIGFFYINDGKLIFSPFGYKNFLPEAYGLHIFFRKPISRTQSVISNSETLVLPSASKPLLMEEEPEYNPSSESAFPHQKRRIGTAWIPYAAAVVLFMLLLFGGYQAIQTDVFTSSENIQHAGYTLPEKFPVLEITSEEDGNKERLKETKTIIPDNNAIQNSVMSVQDQPAVGHTFYYVIIGAFRNKENAVKIMEKLRAKGINASVPYNKERGYYYVAYETYKTPEKAKKTLAKIKKSYPDAWIWERQL